MTEQFWMMDIYFDQKDAVIYKYKFNDVSRSKLGRSLSAFVTSYTKTACADKNRQQSKRIWAPQHFSEELIGSDGQQIAMIAISKVCN